MDFCRICAKADKKPLIPILEDNPLHIFEKLQKLLQIKVLEKSILPKSICLDCLTKLNQFNDFYSTTQENQVILQIIFGEKVEVKPVATPVELVEVLPVIEKSEVIEEHYIIEEITLDTSLSEEHDEEAKTGEELLKRDPVSNKESSLSQFASSEPPPGSHKNKFDRFDCHLCNVQSSRNSRFVEHFKEIHPNEEICYSCYICHLPMTKYRSYIRHVASHHEKRFSCDMCGKNFAQKMTLIQHLNSHSTVKLFKCSECLLEFKQNSSLFKHRKTKHSNSMLTCNECSKTFVNKETLRQHMRSRHNAKKDIICPHCAKTFASRSALSYHRLTKHPDGQPMGELLYWTRTSASAVKSSSKVR